jgi:hypothetical protein
MKRTFRAKRSSFAISNVAPVLRQRVRAWWSLGRSAVLASFHFDVWRLKQPVRWPDERPDGRLLCLQA